MSFGFIIHLFPVHTIKIWLSFIIIFAIEGGSSPHKSHFKGGPDWKKKKFEKHSDKAWHFNTVSLPPFWNAGPFWHALCFWKGDAHSLQLFRAGLFIPADCRCAECMPGWRGLVWRTQVHPGARCGLAISPPAGLYNLAHPTGALRVWLSLNRALGGGRGGVYTTHPCIQESRQGRGDE